MLACLLAVCTLGIAEHANKVQDVHAEETVYASCDFSTKETGHTSYSDEWTYGADWKIKGGANNNAGWEFVKLGGKSASLINPNYIASASSIDEAISKVVVTTNVGNLSTAGSVTDWGVYVYSDADMTIEVDYVAGGSMTKSKSETFTFTPSKGDSWQSDSYYKVSFTIANTTTKNGVVWIDKVDFYSAGDVGGEDTPTTYTVSFNSNGGSAVSAISNVESGATVSTLPTPTKDGYRFLGWFTEGDVEFTTSTAVTGNITVTAKWEEVPTVVKHTVTFVSNGGSRVSSIQVVDGEEIPSDVVPTQYYYKFAGWYLDNDTFNSKAGAITSDVTVYAKWILSGEDYFNSTYVQCEQMLAFDYETVGEKLTFSNISLRVSFHVNMLVEDIVESGFFVSKSAIGLSDRKITEAPVGATKVVNTNKDETFVLNIDNIPLANCGDNIYFLPYAILEDGTMMVASGFSANVFDVADACNDSSVLTIEQKALVSALEDAILEAL